MHGRVRFAVIVMVGFLFWAGCSSGLSEMPDDIVSEIRALGDGPTVSQYFTVHEIGQDGSVFRVSLRLKFVPKSYDEVRVFTDAFVRDTVRILEKYGYGRDVSVWAEKVEGQGFVRVYGRTFYSKDLGTLQFKVMK